MTQISFVYFDVGGVVLLDYSGTNKWEEMKQGLGVTPELDAEFEKIWNTYHRRICLDYDVENLVPIFRNQLRLKLPPDYSMVQDFVNRYDPNPSIWSVIQSIRENYRTGLLTNMYPNLLKTIFARPDLRADWGWEIIVDSSTVMAQKPNPQIFSIAEKMASVAPQEILFIENQQKHIAAAKARGWQTFLYDSANFVQSSADLTAFLQLPTR